MIRFPLWVIRLFGDKNEPCLRYACDADGYVLSFDRLDIALEHLPDNPALGMLVHRLTYDEIATLVADMHEFSVPGICLNPRISGDCGVVIPLNQLDAALNEPESD